MATAKNLADSERAAIGFALLDATAPEPIGFWDTLLDAVPTEAFADPYCRKVIGAARELWEIHGRGTNLDPSAIASATDFAASDLWGLFESDHGTRTTNERAAMGAVERILERHYMGKVKDSADTGQLADALAKLDNIRGRKVGYGLQPYRLADLKADEDNAPDGLKTGFKNLDAVVSIPPEALTIVAGRPSHGKTALLLNMALNMAQLYPDKHFFFFSYEQNRRTLARRLVKAASDGEGGETLFDELSERLWIISEPYPVNDLSNVIGYLCQKYPTGAVFVDYIQKIPSGRTFGTRQLELAHVSAELLRATLKHKAPIVLGAQLGRDKGRTDKVVLDNIREAGDIEQDANLVIGLHNQAVEKAQDNDHQPSETMDLTLWLLKNRDGIVNRSVSLEFNGPKQRITSGEGEDLDELFPSNRE